MVLLLLNALMYKVFPSSLGDLGLKWFDCLPVGSIENFHQLAESFISSVHYKYHNFEGSWFSSDTQERQNRITPQLQ